MPENFQYDETLENEIAPAAYENPTVGTVVGVLVDIVPIGKVENKFAKDPKTAPKVFKFDLAFQIEEENSKGYRFTPRRRFTLSLSKKAAFTPFYEALIGRKVSVAEATGKAPISVKSLMSLIGKSVLLELAPSEDGQYVNINTVLPLLKGMPPLVAKGYTRVKDREPRS